MIDTALNHSLFYGTVHYFYMYCQSTLRYSGGGSEDKWKGNCRTKLRHTYGYRFWKHCHHLHQQNPYPSELKAVMDQKVSGKEIAEPNFTKLMDTDSESTATTYISRKSS